MRRKDREVIDLEQINSIILACDCCRVGFMDKANDEVYIVPLNFAYDSDTRTFYFHGAGQGRKLELAKENAHVGFELDTGHSLVTGEKACDYSYVYQSVVGTGKISIIKDGASKKEALKKIMFHYTDQADWEMPEHMLEHVSILKLEVEKLSCKEHV